LLRPNVAAAPRQIILLAFSSKRAPAEVMAREISWGRVHGPVEPVVSRVSNSWTRLAKLNTLSPKLDQSTRMMSDGPVRPTRVLSACTDAGRNLWAPAGGIRKIGAPKLYANRFSLSHRSPRNRRFVADPRGHHESPRNNRALSHEASERSGRREI